MLISKRRNGEAGYVKPDAVTKGAAVVHKAV